MWLTEKFKREYAELVRTVRNINGPGVKVEWGRGITIHKPGKRWERPHHPSGDDQGVVVMIGTLAAGNYRYLGSILSRNGSTTASAGTTADAVMSGQSGPACLIVNKGDVAGLRLANVNTVHNGEIIGQTTDDPPIPLVMIDTRPGGPMLCRVQQTGGTQGNKTTPASWTYSLRSALTTGTSETPFATNIGLAKPRPNGTATVQGGSDGYGLFIIDRTGAVKLWDAGEIYGSAACPE